MPAEGKGRALTVGSWQIVSLPQGWEFVPQWGLRRSERNAFPSNVSFVEEQLLAGQDLQAYVESQLTILRHHVPDVRVAGPKASSFQEADEVLTAVIHHQADDGRPMVQGQIYVRCRARVGVLTCTTSEDEIRKVQPAFDLICKTARFRPQSGDATKA